jgi:colanic acid/amylovoran biosynthesis protein
VNILIDSCSYNCQNVGDLAMLIVAVSRLRELWPNAVIQIITNAPDRIAKHCGDVRTVPVRGRERLLEERLLGRARRWLPAGMGESLEELEAQLVLRRPRLYLGSLRVKAAIHRRRTTDTAAFLRAIDEADVVVVNGAGIMTDAFRESALGILATLDLAIRRGKPTAIFGHGFGPINDEVLWQRAAEVLPFVSLIGVRESTASVPLLNALRVNPANVIVTGDDALEMAFSALEHRHRFNPYGPPKIGVNVRVAPYAEVESCALSIVRDVLTDVARERHARMIPIPIAHHGGRMDVDTLRGLLRGLGDGDGGASLDTPQLVIDRIGECRVMVTGSYHGAVFALAQGIPVVALVKSTYYDNKMRGLRQQYGVGCQIVRLDDDALEARLRAAIDRAWIDADRLQGLLLNRTADQIQRGREAYARLREVVV